MTKPDDSTLAPQEYARVRKEAERLLREAGALGRFPTPVATVMGAGKVTLAQEDVLNEGFLRSIRRKIGAGTRAEVAAWLRKQQHVGMLEDMLDPLQELPRWGTVDNPVVECQGQHQRGPNFDAVANGHGPAVEAAHA